MINFKDTQTVNDETDQTNYKIPLWVKNVNKTSNSNNQPINEPINYTNDINKDHNGIKL